MIEEYATQFSSELHSYVTDRVFAPVPTCFQLTPCVTVYQTLAHVTVRPRALANAVESYRC